MKILAILQNQWFRDPEKVRRLIAQCEPDRRARYRRKMIAYALFAGCKTGKVLKYHFGQLCEIIVWEEASPEIGGFASAKFPADLSHLKSVIGEVAPDIILAFGTIAKCGLINLNDSGFAMPKHRIFAPHPTARHPSTGAELNRAAAQLYDLLKT